MQIIGVTGISGTGKSTVSQKICKQTLGKYINADEVAKDLSKVKEEYYEKIVEEFGKEILKENLEIDRKKLADIIFSDKIKKRKLDILTNKYVVEKIKKEVENIKDYDTIIMDVPLLFESGLNKICDKTIGVVARKDICIERIVKRDKINKEAAEARIDSQNSENFFKINCDYIISNDNDADLEKQIREILEGKNLSNKNIIHIYEKDIEYIQFRKLLEYEDKIKHLYSLKPLNFKGSIDNKEIKEKTINSYKKVCEALEIDLEKIYRPLQMHTDIVKKTEEEMPWIYKREAEEADGLITDKKNEALSLTFADCTSLYFYDPVKNIIGNIHSGWRGTYKEIARVAVRKLEKEYGVDAKNLICCIGPNIRKCCFEVDEDVKDMFYDKFKYTGKIEEIITKNKNKYSIDTILINRLILKEEGLKEENIIESGICTKCKVEKLHSYRADGEQSGRNTSIICLK